MKKIAVVGLVGESVFLPVENFHVGGETIEANDFLTQPGGKGFNQAVAAARFGAEVYFFAAIGKEGYAKTVEDFMSNEKITTVLSEKDKRTAYAVILTDKNGTNHVTEYTGAALDIEDVKLFEPYIKKADILMISNEVSEEVNTAFVKIAVDNNVKIIYNPAPYHNVSKKLWENVDWITPNEHENVGFEDFDNCIVTLGEKGCYIKSTGETVKAEKVKAVDTTGAGDTFNGVFAVMIAEGKSVSEAVRIANKASGISVTRKGAVTSIPFRNEVL